MVDALVKKLKKKEAELEGLRRLLLSKQSQRLASLHEEFGLGSTEELIEALQGLGRRRPGRPPGKKKSSAKPAPAARGGSRKSKRARLSEQLKDRIRAALKSGKKGAVVAREFGISYPTLHKIKTQIGLVKQRSKRGKSSKS